jgi:molybdopterin-containing oxidoreductase family iron-sulfur binding subunit
MAIDQNVCTGCNACVVACQAENNVPVVGKSQVLNGREMHWLRVDRYYTGSIDSPDTYHQPMPCQQCESAPCEVVCPVSATVHSDEGPERHGLQPLRRHALLLEQLPVQGAALQLPALSGLGYAVAQAAAQSGRHVRSRGVMEKCTYCVQRISQARVAAKLDDREIRDGEVVTACQGACPTEAIVFGNLNDPNSRVSKLEANTLNYRLLEELNVRPRTSYMAVVRNPNTTLEPASATNGEERG